MWDMMHRVVKYSSRDAQTKFESPMTYIPTVSVQAEVKDSCDSEEWIKKSTFDRGPER